MIALRITLSTDCHYFLCLIKEYLENSSSSFFSSLFSFIRVFLSPLYFYLPFFPCFVMSFSLLLISLLLFLFYFHISSCPFSLLFFSFSLYILFLLLFFFCSIPPLSSLFSRLFSFWVRETETTYVLLAPCPGLRHTRWQRRLRVSSSNA